MNRVKMLKKLHKAALKADRRACRQGGATPPEIYNFLEQVHGMMPNILELIKAVDATIAPDGDLRTLDMGRILRALEDLKGNA